MQYSILLYFCNLVFHEALGPVHHQIFVKGLRAMTYTVWVNLDWSAKFFYSLLWRYGYDNWGDPGFFRLYFAGRMLWGDKSLRQYGVDSACTLHLCGRFGDTAYSLAIFIHEPVLKYNRSVLFRKWRIWIKMFLIVSFWAKQTYLPESNAFKRYEHKFKLQTGQTNSTYGIERMRLHTRVICMLLFWNKVMQRSKAKRKRVVNESNVLQ